MKIASCARLRSLKNARRRSDEADRVRAHELQSESCRGAVYGAARLHGLRDAKAGGAFKAVCAETTSRYGRDEEDRAAARKRLTFAGVAIYTPADGEVSRVVDGIKAVMDAHQLEDLKVMIRRGMSAVVRDGRHAGGLTYGYRPIPGRPGELAIVADQAEIVRRIFREYIAGATPRTITARLNAEGLPPPRGTYWRASTINGHTQRHTGILQCELYRGRLIWNRAHRVRDPDTGQRIWRYNPESAWQRSDAPHLRIIDDDTFGGAQRMREKRARAHRRDRQRPKRILSGLLRCGRCDAGMSKKDIMLIRFRHTGATCGIPAEKVK